MDYEGRRAQLRHAMVDQGIDLIAVAPGENMHYLLGYHPHPDERPCYLLVAQHGEALLMPSLNASQAEAKVGLFMATYTDAEGPDAALAQLASRLDFAKARKLLVDDSMRADFALLLQDAAPAAKLGVTTGILGQMRMQKDGSEIDALRRNALMADKAIQAGYAAVRPGVTEAELARIVAAAFTAAGAESLGFAIIGAGPNSAFPHHATSDRAVRAGEPVLFDIGARSGHYNSDITRMAFAGEPDAEYLKVHQIVDEAVQAALAIIRPGIAAGDVDAAARQVIEKAGYGEYFTHRVGHGIGLTGHEPPYLTGTSQVILAEGMTFSVEPGIYLPGRFGVRLEEIVTVTASGVAVFSQLSRDLHRMG